MKPSLPARLVPEDQFLIRHADLGTIREFALPATWVADVVGLLPPVGDGSAQIRLLASRGVPPLFALALVAISHSRESTFPNGLAGGFVIFIAATDTGQSTVSLHPHSPSYRSWDEYWLAMAMQSDGAAGILG